MAHGSRTHCLDRSMYTPNPVKLQARERVFLKEPEKGGKCASAGRYPAMEDPFRLGIPFEKKSGSLSDPGGKEHPVRVGNKDAGQGQEAGFVAHEKERIGKVFAQKRKESLPSEFPGEKVRREFEPAFHPSDGMLLPESAQEDFRGLNGARQGTR